MCMLSRDVHFCSTLTPDPDHTYYYTPSDLPQQGGDDGDEDSTYGSTEASVQNVTNGQPANSSVLLLVTGADGSVQQGLSPVQYLCVTVSSVLFLSLSIYDKVMFSSASVYLR